MSRTTMNRRVRRGALGFVAVGLLAAGLGACSDDDSSSSEPGGTGSSVGAGERYEATIRRTSDGVAHITGSTIADAAFGQGWAQAEDRTCDLADQVVKVKGERARWFGPGDDDANLHSDIAWRTIGIMDRAEADFAEATPEVVELLTAFTAGWNAHLDEVGADDVGGWCAGEEWLQPLEPVDVYGYARAIALMASAAPVSGYIATATPPDVPTGDDSPEGEAPPATDSDDADEGEQALGSADPDFSALAPSVASNGWALGSERTESGGGMLLANPHFPWEGELRFWESHVTVPGEVDMYGAMLSGVPGIGIGFNDQFGWTHTVSAGSRFTAYRLDLVPGSPTTYRYGDEEREMTSRDFTVEVLGDDGEVDEVDHTAWFSHYGPIIDFPGFGWSEANAISYRDANIDNDEFLDQYLGMLKAQDLDEFIAVHEEINGVPLFNTIATSADGRAWYADTSATPNLSEAAIARYEQMVADDPIVAIAADSQAILLDGSDPVFEWVEEEGARDPGLVPADRQPQLLRRDYVFNANDPFWMANSNEPLAGDYSILHGRQERPLSPRTHQNLVVMDELLADGELTLDDLTSAALANQSYLATQLVPAIVERCRELDGPVPVPALEADADGLEGLPAASIDLTEACDVLEAWDGAYDLDRAGPPLFRELVAQFDRSDLTDAGLLWAEPFDPARPTVTPSGLAPAFSEGDDPVLEGLARAVQVLEVVGWPVAVTLGEVQFSWRNGVRIPMHGGFEVEGVTNMVGFRTDHTILDPTLLDTERERVVVGSALARYDGELGYIINGGSSFIMALSYGPDGPEAKAFMVYGNTEDRSADVYTEVTERFSDKDWRSVAFNEADVAAATTDTMIVRG